MPAIRPEDISNLIRLTYELRALMARLIPEDGTVDAGLAAVVDEDAPNEEGIGALGSEHNLFPWSDELFPRPSIGVSVTGVVALVELNAIEVAVFHRSILLVV